MRVLVCLAYVLCVSVCMCLCVFCVCVVCVLCVSVLYKLYVRDNYAPWLQPLAAPVTFMCVLAFFMYLLRVCVFEYFSYTC